MESRLAGALSPRFAVFVAVLLPAVAFGAASASAFEPKANGRQVFRVAKGGDPIMLPVEVGSRRYDFMLDTGSAVTSFDVSLKPLLGGRTGQLPLYTTIDRDPLEVKLFKAPPLSLGGGQTLDGVREVVCTDFLARELFDVQRVYGVLGMDAVGRMIIQIDFDRGELSVLPSVPRNPGQELPIYLVLGVPSVRLAIGVPETPYFWLDTGDATPGSGTLDSRLFRSLLSSKQASVVGESTHRTAIRESRVRMARLSEFQIGDFNHRGLVFSEGSFNALSLEFLSRYVVTFDFPRRRVFMRPAKRHMDAERLDSSGLSLMKRGGDWIVTRTKENSAAEAAGLRKGDVLVEIDGVAAGMFARADVRRTMRTPSVHSVVVRRKNTDLRVLLNLKQGDYEK
jgi:hypothetical protein